MSNDLITNKAQLLSPVNNPDSMLFDPNLFQHSWRVATMFSRSNLVPTHLRGKVEDCFLALYTARRLNEDPMVVMQNIYIVGSRPGWATSYLIARCNSMGVFKEQISWDVAGSGENLSVTAKATLKNGQQVKATVDMKTAKAENWTRNAKYQTMPELMLRYRSATMLINLYAPEVKVGVTKTVEELETEYVEVAATQQNQPSEYKELPKYEEPQQTEVKPISKIDDLESMLAEPAESPENAAMP